MMRKMCVYLSVIAAVASGVGCAAVRQQVGAVLMPTQTEIQLGQELAAQIESQEPLLADPQITAYVSEVLAGLTPFAGRDRADITFDVKVVDDPGQVNAFALPGGHVYVYTGLLLLADNEAELAGVLAHELGHVVGRHSARRLGTQMGLALLTSVALGEQPDQLAQLTADLLKASTMAHFSRDDEREADLYGLRYAAAAGYDPRGLEAFFDKLLKLEGGGQQNVFEGLLASHPQTRDRIQLLRQRIERAGYSGGTLEQERYQQMRVLLRARPLPPQP